MLILLSPAKSLDLSPAPDGLQTTQPRFEYDTGVLLKRCKKLSPRSIRRLMGVSEELAELTFERFQQMTLPATGDSAKPAVLAFAGDVYRGLDASTLSPGDLEWAQDRLRILSGLYGVLRPLDLIQPYRLEMGSRLSNTRGKNLYHFWRHRLADSLNADHGEHPVAAVLNLASAEYARAAVPKRLEPPVIDVAFQEERDGGLRTIGFSAKRARGLMARFAIEQRIDRPEELRAFAEEGYAFRPDLSDDHRLAFVRSQEWAAA